jgi:catechol 2,3-dioxygenase-like lactoylglutathione lyase family enzyme
VTLVAASLLAFTPSGSAQLASPNAAGVSMGSLHFVVKDVDATRQFWTALGGRAIRVNASGIHTPVGIYDAVVFPDVVVFLYPGPRLGLPIALGVTDGSVVNHVAFRVRTFKQVESAGLSVERLQQFPGVGSVTTPDGERIEIFEDSATNLTFTPDTGPIDPVAARHNRPLDGSIAFHHVHLNVPAESVAAAKAWYARRFGGTPGKRSNYDAVDLPGVNINISAATRPTRGTSGRALDRIGFEVTNLPAFCKRLPSDLDGISQGVIIIDSITINPERVSLALGAPASSTAGGAAPSTVPVDRCDSAEVNGSKANVSYGQMMLTDPWGTQIVLTEGLRRLSQ